MATYEIPMTPTPQTFRVSLVGVTYQLTVRWNSMAGVWVLDISSADGVKILSGLPIVANTDLLEPFAYLGIGGKLAAQTTADLTAPPTVDGFGATSKLYFITP